MVDISVIGDINVDLLTSPISFYPGKDSQALVPTISLFTGGGAANFAFAISRLGLKTRLVGLVGNDIFGEYIIRKSREFSIETKIKKTNKERTGITFGVQSKDGSRSLFTFRGTNANISRKDFTLSDISGKAIHIGGYNFVDNLRNDVYGIVRYAKRKKMLVSLDPDLKSGIRFNIGELKKVLRFVDIFFPDRIEGEILTGKKDEQEIVKILLGFGCKIVVLKCGDYGCIVANKKRNFKIRGLKIRPVNSTGVGDIFNAAFVFNYLKTKNLEKAGIFANATGALAITMPGERRFVKEKDVISFLKKHGR